MYSQFETQEAGKSFGEKRSQESEVRRKTNRKIMNVEPGRMDGRLLTPDF
jgi:hypothetical protein